MSDVSDQSGAPPASGDDVLAGVLQGLPLRAGSFIVTIYGDAVEPRGGRLWMGNLIETCGAVGISETLVRTAVSRLVAAGQLMGERAGRRSYYALTDEARREYLAAARRVFEKPASEGWSFIRLPHENGDEAAILQRAGFARLAPGWFLGAAPPPQLPGVVSFAAAASGAGEDVRAMAAAHWPLDACEAAYEDVLERFGPVGAALRARLRLAPEQALHLRLLLVHLFREAALRDPGLPDEAMPENWAGWRARAMFASLYRALSPSADAYVGARFEAEEGPLPASTPAIERRLALLAERPGA